MKLLIDIHKRRRNIHSLLHRETQPVSLSVVVIRILSENHNLHIFKRSQMKRIENIFRPAEKQLVLYS